MVSFNVLDANYYYRSRSGADLLFWNLQNRGEDVAQGYNI